MMLIVNNTTATNVILSIDETDYRIGADEQNVVLQVTEKSPLLSVLL